ncbi:hypothetical protein LQF12_02190 [Ruania suaedae]|uniref:hypothetical protein n=1 Tax=Ruania suaedae TaxID=2897774 RepID=UPI001E4E93B8|nr:hypothetical protein [Ruania suaedae]UFU03442.1 hypothetical protein LQF12_02190 [Ruania suaedae]
MSQYIAKAKAVKVAVGSSRGHRVAHIVRAGGVIPEGVEQGALDGLVKRGLIEAVKAAEPKAEAVDEGAYKGVSVAHLKAEIEKRNDGREDEMKVVPAEPGNRPQIVAALIADDEQ